MLKDVSDPLTDPTKYIEKMEALLSNHSEYLSVMKSSLNKFKEKIREEEEFNDRFMNIFDLNKKENIRNDELQLLDDLP